MAREAWRQGLESVIVVRTVARRPELSVVAEAPGVGVEPVQRRPFPWRRIVLVLLAAVAVLVGGVWLTHPKAIYPVGNEIGVRVAVGQTVVVATNVITSGPTQNSKRYQSVALRAVAPVVVKNTAGAGVAMVLCTPTGTYGVGSVRAADLGQYCSQVAPLGSGTVALGLGPPMTQLLAEITPSRPGVVRIEGFEVTYRDGIRWGTQTGGINITLVSDAAR
jgi:hypothetical protein